MHRRVVFMNIGSEQNTYQLLYDAIATECEPFDI